MANSASVTAVADINQTAAEALAAAAGGAECYRDPQALLASGEVDAVSVCTPPTAHEAPVVEALERGIPVLCEKPFAATIEAGRRMVAAAEHNGTFLMVAFPHRFRPAVQKMREIVQGNKLGDLVFFHNSFCGPVFWVKDTWYTRKSVAGGGVLLDICSHSVDLFRFLAGEVVEQHAVFHRHLHGIDVEDAGIIALKGKSGVIGTISASWVVGAGQASIDLFGQRGRLSYMFGDEMTFSGHNGGRETIRVENSDGFIEEVGHFLAAIRGEVTLSCTGHDGLRTLEIILPLYRQAVPAHTES
jgi:predicted dehydrogenase